MCGIVGLVRPDMGPADEQCLRRMCTRLMHRGPDDQGYYVGDCVALGMRRLAIIDVQGGQQPLCNEDRSIWVVFNGEIYNYQELVHTLEKRGHQFGSRSDTECLVHLYEDYGDECVSFLRGMFAFAIWDARHKRLLLARDRFGIKPLYYSQNRDGLAFASEIKSLLTLDTREHRISLRGVSDFFTFGYIPGPTTIYEGIREVPPAHICVWQDGNLQLRRYWDLLPAPDVNKPIDFFAEGLLHHLKEAIRLHLMSEVPLGAFLSGGIDSSTIVALMADGSEGRAKTFTVGFEIDHSGFDERPFARMVAEQFGTDHSECLLNPRIEDTLPAIVRALDEPFADSSMIPTFLICQAARKWVTVALSGLGGDELFGGYERYRGALLAEYYRRLPGVLRHELIDRFFQAMPEGHNGGLWPNRLRRFLRGAELDLRQRYQQYIAAYTDGEKAELFSGDMVQELQKSGLTSTPLAMKEGHEDLSSLDRMLLADIDTYLSHDLLKMTDRLSMCHSLEVRVPFLDHKLVEFAATIPSGYKIRRWQKKQVLIRAVDGILPKRILGRGKRGFSIPLDRWLRGPLREFTAMYLNKRALQEVGLFCHQTVARIVEEHQRGFRNHESKIWTLLSFMLWHDLCVRKPTESNVHS